EPLMTCRYVDGCGSAVIRKARGPGKKANWLMQKRCALFTSEWTGAGMGALVDILGSGWSGTEGWGVWGVGPCHILNVTMDNLPTEDVHIEIDAGAALFAARPELQIDVCDGDRCLTTWQFSLAENRAQRMIRIPLVSVRTEDRDFPVIRLEFRPRSVSPVIELDATRNDLRPLGLALFGIRRGP
ncbi:MAG: hypothetical protein M3Y22_01270, partial [Pseudomonadota bacterium]|nr:hypothetical protein [Pseudomonadota bacterium]